MRYRALVVDYAGVLTEPGVPALVRRVRERGLRTALLSNADRPPPGLPDVFDAVVVSGEVGVAKPDPAVYRLVADRLDVPVATCLFIDDLPTNTRGAAAAGMTAIHHRDLDTTEAELAILLDLAD